MSSNAKQMPMQTPMDLMIHELTSIRSAERIIEQMLQDAQGMVQNEQLREGLRMHAEQTREQSQRLEQIFQQMGAQPHPIECLSARGLHEELQIVMQSNPSPEVLDGVVAAGACKTEHLEIAAYSGLVEKAQAMGMTEVAQLLQQNLREEEQMLKQVEKIAQQMTQRMASMADMGDQPSSAPPA